MASSGSAGNDRAGRGGAGRDLYNSPLGVLYSAYMERPALSRPISRRLWGGDSGAYYESMSAIGEVAEGGTVVDCPCGAGPALRALRPSARVRYVAADLSPAMLRRARQRARQRARSRGLEGVEFVEANATDIPLPAGSADLFLSYWGLHCFDDPAAALIEAGRVLKPGGRLVGSCFVLGTETWRQRLLIRPGFGGLGPVGSQAEIEAWLAEAGFGPAATKRSGPMLFFDARHGDG